MKYLIHFPKCEALTYFYSRLCDLSLLFTCFRSLCSLARNSALWSTQYCGSQDSSVSTVTALWAGRPTHCGAVPGQSKNSVLQSTQISHKAHSASCTVSIRGSFCRGKVVGVWTYPVTSVQWYWEWVEPYL